LTFATRSLAVLVAWLVFSKTKSEFSLGLLGLSEAIPFLSTAIFAGVAADNFSRKKIIVLCSIGYLMCCFSLLFIYIKLDFFIFNFGMFPIYFVIFITGIIRGFYAPSHGAFAAQLVPKQLYIYSSVWNSLSFGLSVVIGPAVGGLVYGFFGMLPALIIVIVFASISILLFLSIKSRPVLKTNNEEGVFEKIKQGLKFVFKTQELVGAFALDMFAVLFGGAIALLPAFADKILACGPQGLGFLQAAPAIGAISTSFFLVGNPIKKNAGKKMLFSVAMFGVCIIGFALSRNYILSFVCLMFSGVFDEVSVVVRSTIVQLYSPEEMRGRVESVSKIFIGSSNEIGAFESGTAARFMGLVPSVVFGGTVTLLVVAIAYKKLPKIKNLEF
jgi:MFS family permease